ncbi:MFS transporter [Alphaproteobacteria bacterium KMM 3653]|uniref:MFS transporter n=1 Tax=Harenicola maris TaxID=2841044 RepID=A0AAP2G2V5_9RHOB|nr:MFS transporter [Harenicola maris]
MSARRGFALVLLLWAAGLGGAAQYAKFAVVYEILGGVYPQAGAWLGWIVSLVGFIGVFLGVVAGILVARAGVRRALIAAMWLGAAVSALQAFMPALPWMLLLRGLEGVSHLGIVVAAPTLIAQVAPPAQRGLALTLWGTFFGVAFAVMTFGGLPLAQSSGVGALFAAHGVYMACLALALGFWLRALPGYERPAALPFGAVLRMHGAIYRSAFVSAPAAGWLFYTFCFVSILTVLPPFLDESIRALVMGAMPLVSIAVSMTLGVALLRRMPAVQVVYAGFAASLGCMVWLWFAPAAGWACIALAASMGLIQGASFAAVPQLNAGPERQAQANGAMAQMGNLGNTLGTPVMAVALAQFGYVSLPLLGGGAFLAGLILHLWLARVRARSG